ncbi:dual specificity protein phosphatase 14-like, partial [Actinia tenebrosa]|uniref:protein-serine/threonine phosphatase n=1 Tax=Actinia tenebrosa TaxID=6105 RepID=A0A6P8IYR8_ACTTE
MHMYRSTELRTAVHYSPLSIMSQITDFLYLGSLRMAMDEEILKAKGITHIINATMDESPKYKISIKCMRVKVNDDPECNIGRHFDNVADKIEEVNKKSGRVLVHCVAGVSRSSTLVIAYLMKYQKMNLKDAYTMVKEKRALINPNRGFWLHLIDYERKLFGKTTVNMKDTKY